PIWKNQTISHLTMTMNFRWNWSFKRLPVFSISPCMNARAFFILSLRDEITVPEGRLNEAYPIYWWAFFIAMK
ncbi:MAG: hypothetical protein DRJ05_04465, partial [Bacteroidetes bacterium]